MTRPKISIVIPIYNEEEGIQLLYDRVISAIEDIGEDYEIICVNDGSQDSSLQLLIDLHKQNSRFKVVSFSRNFGHQFAVLAGLMEAKGEFIGVMDGDLQDPPELFTDFLGKLESGFDVVYAQRKKRKEGMVKKFFYWAYYRLFYSIAETKIPVDSGDFCLMRRKVLDVMLKMPEQSLYLRGIRSWVGFRQTGYEYDRDERQAGEPKYNFKELFKLAYNGIFSFSSMPIRFMRKIGYVTLIFCFGFGIKIMISYLLYKSAPAGFTTMALAIFFLSGVQMISLGVLGEYVHRTYNESRKRPLFIIDEKHIG